jgi:hypothetical protein
MYTGVMILQVYKQITASHCCHNNNPLIGHCLKSEHVTPKELDDNKALNSCSPCTFAGNSFKSLMLQFPDILVVRNRMIENAEYIKDDLAKKETINSHSLGNHKMVKYGIKLCETTLIILTETSREIVGHHL